MRESLFYEELEKFLNKHGASLKDEKIYVSLGEKETVGGERLSVEKLSPGKEVYRLSVAYYFEQNGDLVPDPDIVFLVDNSKRLATPIEFQNQLYYVRARTPEQKKDIAIAAESLLRSVRLMCK